MNKRCFRLQTNVYGNLEVLLMEIYVSRETFIAASFKNIYLSVSCETYNFIF
jgi:hypothetical protein